MSNEVYVDLTDDSDTVEVPPNGNLYNAAASRGYQIPHLPPQMNAQYLNAPLNSAPPLQNQFKPPNQEIVKIPRMVVVGHPVAQDKSRVLPPNIGGLPPASGVRILPPNIAGGAGRGIMGAAGANIMGAARNIIGAGVDVIQEHLNKARVFQQMHNRGAYADNQPIDQKYYPPGV